MSWCRFSTICDNNISSQLYVYDDCMGGVTIMVAGNKQLNEENAPRIPSLNDVNFIRMSNRERTDWFWHWDHCKQERDKWLEENSKYVPIGLEYDGETFNVSDKEELIDLLTKLRDVGYNFPDQVFAIADVYEEDA